MSDEESGVSPIPAASYGTTVDQSSDHGKLNHTVESLYKEGNFLRGISVKLCVRFLSNAIIKSN